MTPVVRARLASAFVAAVLASALAGASLVGQAPAQSAPTATDPQLRLKWFDQHLALKETSPFKGLSWQFLGPTNISGRVTDVAVVTPRGKSYTIFVATATGGVWKTDNDGVTWTPVFDQGVTTSIGDVTVAPSNPDIVYAAASGHEWTDNEERGVYKTTDGGASWNVLGGNLPSTYVHDIVIHPRDRMIVAATHGRGMWVLDAVPVQTAKR